MGRKNRKQQSDKGQRRFSYKEDEKGFGSLVNSYHTDKLWKMLDPTQSNYATAIGKSRVVMVDAQAGTGKTTIAVMRGFEMLREGVVNRIVYVRFPDKRGLKLGFEPGDMKMKQLGYMKPFYDAALKCGLSTEDVEALILSETIELCTDTHMRGRTLDHTFLIIDEAQNGDVPDLRLVMTRLVENGYGVIIGHSEQQDNKLPTYGPDQWNAFQVYQYHMNKMAFTTICELHHNYRGPISRWADKVGDTLKELEQKVM